jgi:hypothetical protein
MLCLRRAAWLASPARRFASLHASVERRLQLFTEEQRRQAAEEAPARRGQPLRVSLAGAPLSARAFETTPAICTSHLDSVPAATISSIQQIINIIKSSLLFPQQCSGSSKKS